MNDWLQEAQALPTRADGGIGLARRALNDAPAEAGSGVRSLQDGSARAGFGATQPLFNVAAVFGVTPPPARGEALAPQPRTIKAAVISDTRSAAPALAMAPQGIHADGGSVMS